MLLRSSPADFLHDMTGQSATWDAKLQKPLINSNQKSSKNKDFTLIMFYNIF